MSTVVIDTNQEEGKTQFAKAIRDAVSESFDMLGKSQKSAVKYMLKREHRVDVEALGTDLVQIIGALKSIFGAGAPFLIDLIFKNLSLKLSRSHAIHTCKIMR